MNTIIISLGSNENCAVNLELCRELLVDIFGNVFFSKTSTTTPYGEQYKNNFLNQLALTHTDQDIEDVIYNLKLVEKQIGRQPNDKTQGIIRIDADLVKWNDNVLKEEDWKRSYVADLLPSLYERATAL